MAKDLSTKVQLVLPTFTSVLAKAKPEALQLMLKRPNSVRVARIAGFAISGVTLSELLTTDELYELTNQVYFYVEDRLSGSIEGVKDDELLAKLRA